MVWIGGDYRAPEYFLLGLFSGIPKSRLMKPIMASVNWARYQSIQRSEGSSLL